MHSHITLYPQDFVIIKSNGGFYKFEDGEYIIFPTRHQAEKDAKEWKNSKVISCTRLPKKLRRDLRKNIEKFNELPF